MKKVVLAVLVAAVPAAADPVLHVGSPSADPPTPTALGVYLPITGDDNFTATVAVRYRPTGSATWQEALPLQHVHTEVVTGLATTPQFAGSIFDLAPDTSYDIELHATDADGPVDTTLMMSARTRALPHDPMTPRTVAVTDVTTFNAALSAAQPGDIITLANGTYSGQFSFTASGTASQPIVIRGASEDGVILDGGGCTGCNVLEAYGSYVHIDNLTIAHGERALRFQGTGAIANVVRYVHITDVVLGIGSNTNQQDFYIADNILEGRLVWPCVYTSDDVNCNAGGTHGLHANDDGIHVEGTGHVVAHNRISGFGDAMKTEYDGAVSVDFYGNDVLWTYDNGVELDGSLRNTRAMRNRFTNTFATISFQPIYGGPSYAIRNVLVNVADEQFKLHANGSTPTVGAVLYHNTVVRGTRALQCSTANEPLYFTTANNLYVGPTALAADGHTVSWDVPGISTASMDYDGFYPDGMFEFAYSPNGTTYADFAAMVAAGVYESHGTLVDNGVLGGVVGTTDWTMTLAPSTPMLPPGSTAVDRGVVLPQIDDSMVGVAPDLGAIESTCGPPIYGPRPVGIDETNEPIGCARGDSPGDDTAIGDDAGNPGGNPGGARSSGGCCRTSSGGGDLVSGVLVVLVVVRRRRRGDKRMLAR